MPESITPEIVLTGSAVKLTADKVLEHALVTYQNDVRRDLERRVLAGPISMKRQVFGAIVREVIGGHLGPFRVLAGAAFRIAAQNQRDRALLPATLRDIAADADAAARDLGAYMAAKDANAVLEGYSTLVNAKMPPKEAARRAGRAYGLTGPQMRTAFRLKDDGVDSKRPGAYKSKIESFIRKALKRRVDTIVKESLFQVEADALQAAWEEGLENGTIPATALKVWFTAADERTCPVCAPMDKVSVGIREKFKLPDGNKVKGPGVHVNCRCTLELAYDGEEISKADEWEPEEHPRGAGGRFRTKLAEAPLNMELAMDASPFLAGPRIDSPDQARLNVARLLADRGPVADAGPRMGGPKMAAGPAMNAGPQVARLGAAGGPERQKIIVAGREMDLRKMNMAHQMQIAAVVAGNAEHQEKPAWVPDAGVDPMDNQWIAFTTPRELNVIQYGGGVEEGGGRLKGLTEGAAQIEKPLRFVNSHDRAGVRLALDEALGDLDAYLRADPYDESLEDMGWQQDPGVIEAAADLRVAAMSGSRSPKGTVRVQVTPEEASEAWRNVLAPQGSGYRMFYEVEAYDETGRTVGRARVSAATIVALTAPDGHHVTPHVVIAPFGTWGTASGKGATTTVPGTDHKHVTGAFRYQRQSGVIVLTPDNVHGRLGRDLRG